MVAHRHLIIPTEILSEHSYRDGFHENNRLISLLELILDYKQPLYKPFFCYWLDL